jgi:hypothetical protein
MRELKLTLDFIAAYTRYTRRRGRSVLGMTFYEGEGTIMPLKRRGNNVRNGTFYDCLLCIEHDLPLFLAVRRQNKTL